MRVLYIDYSVGFGGAFKSLALTLRGLSSVDQCMVSSQDPSLVRDWFPGLDIGPYRRVVNYRTKARIESTVTLPGVHWLAVKAFAAADLLTTGANYLRFVRFVRRQRVDLVHVNNGFIPDAILAARRAGVPCVVHLRGFPVDDGFQNSVVCRDLASVIAVSNAVGASLHDSMVPSSAITTIYDPVDLAASDRAAAARQRVRAECKLDDDVVAMGIFGRVVRWKGQLEFAQAAAGAMRANPKLRAVIVGDGSDGGPAYFDEVRAFIHSSGVADRFVLTGYRSNVDEYYAAMDIVVHASTSPEPFGMVVPEGMAAARPVIATDAGGPHEIVDHGVDGLLVPPGDVLALEAAILDLASSANVRARMGEAGRRKAAAMFGVDANAAAVTAVYQAALVRSARLSTGKVGV